MQVLHQYYIDIDVTYSSCLLVCVMVLHTLTQTRESMHEYWLADAASVVIEYILPMITALLQSEATAEQIANSKGITSSSHDHTAYSATARNGGISNNNKDAVSTLSLTSSNGMMMRKLPAALRSVLLMLHVIQAYLSAYCLHRTRS
jgi:hypothetical protein